MYSSRDTLASLLIIHVYRASTGLRGGGIESGARGNAFFDSVPRSRSPRISSRAIILSLCLLSLLLSSSFGKRVARCGATNPFERPTSLFYFRACCSKVKTILCRHLFLKFQWKNFNLIEKYPETEPKSVGKKNGYHEINVDGQARGPTLFALSVFRAPRADRSVVWPLARGKGQVAVNVPRERERESAT